ncbi:MAG: sodium/proline symporter [Gammaproteobacteria bacterium]|nr:sodium/proline symporter [Gammaproteobacteria bacterium]
MNEFSVGFAIYFLVIAVIAAIAYRRTQTDFDYDIGGKSLSAPVAALSAGASDMSGWLLLGLPGAIYLAGLGESWIIIGLLLGAYLNWQFVAPRLRLMSSAYEEEAATLPQFFRLRTGYSGVSLRLVASLVVIVFFTVYTSAGFVASAKLFQSVMGWDYHMAVVCGVVIIMVYTVAGGFLAVSWTDAFQALLMLVALIALPVFVLQTDIPSELSFTFESVSVVGTISLLAWGLGYFGQPHVLARFMALKNPSQMVRAKAIGMSWMLIATVGAIAIGLVGAIAVPDLADPETVFIRVADAFLNPYLAGLLIAAILAAVMSTVDSQLIVASTCIVNDLFQINRRKLFMSRLVVVGVALGAGVIAINENSVVLDVVAYAWAGLGASFGPAVLFSLFWRRTTGPSIVAGMIVGASTTLVWHTLGALFGGVFSDVYEMIPAFCFASIAIAIVALSQPDTEAEKRFRSDDELKASLSGVRAS